jgi:glycosyltransferase involved in cell wall biosynthesis
LGLEDARGPFAEHATSLGISDRVVFTGHMDDGELVLLYQATSLFVFPSRYEGFGLPVIEALGCGAPAIVGRNSPLVELVDAEERCSTRRSRSRLGARSCALSATSGCVSGCVGRRSATGSGRGSRT